MQLFGMDLSDLRALVQVVEYGSFQRAAVGVRASRSGLRRQVERLEKELGVPLLRRGARGIDPTAAGQEVLAGAATLLRDATALVERAQASRDDARGTIRFIVPSGFPVEARARALQALRTAHPELDAEVIEAEDPLTQLTEPFDLMLHYGDVPDREGWFSHVIARIPTQLRATPTYLERHGRPTSIEQLATHTLAQWSSPLDRGLPLREGGSATTSPWLRTANIALLHALGRAHEAIVYAPVLPPIFEARSGGDLAVVLDDVVGGTLTIRALSPRPSRVDPKVRAVLENLQRLLAALGTK